MKRKIDIHFENNIHIRLIRLHKGNNIQIIIYDENNKELLRGPFLPAENIAIKLLAISKYKDLSMYLKSLDSNPVIDTPDFYYNPSDWM